MRREPLFSFMDPQVLASGLMPDKHPVQSALWTTAAGVHFYSGKIRKRLQASLLVTPSAGVVRGLGQQQTSDGSRWVWAGIGDDVFRWRFGAAEGIDGGLPWVENEGAAPASFYDFTPWGDWMVFNSPAMSRPRLFKPGVSNGEIASAPENVLQMMKFNNFLMAIGWDVGHRRFSWSDADDIEAWAGGEGHEAGDLPFEDLDTPMRAVGRLGSQIAVLAEDQLGLINYVGAPFYFGRRIALDGIGAVGKAALASDGRLLYGLGRNGAWRSDGTTFQYIDEGAVRDFLQDRVNWNQASKCVVSRNDRRGTILFDLLIDGEGAVPNYCLEFDPRTGAWSQGQAGWTSRAERKVFQHTLAGSGVGGLYYAEFQNTGSGALDLKSKPLALSGPHTGLILDQAVFFAHTASGVEFRVGSAQSLEAVPTWTAWLTLEASGRTYSWKPLPSGVWHYVELRSIADTWNLDLQGFMLFGSAEGLKREAH